MHISSYIIYEHICAPYRLHACSTLAHYINKTCTPYQNMHLSYMIMHAYSTDMYRLHACSRLAPHSEFPIQLGRFPTSDSHPPPTACTTWEDHGLNFGNVPNSVDHNVLIYPILWWFNTHMVPVMHLHDLWCFALLKDGDFQSKLFKNQVVYPGFVYPAIQKTIPRSSALLTLLHTLQKIKQKYLYIHVYHIIQRVIWQQKQRGLVRSH